MKAQLASPEAFKQAGLDYATTLLGIRFRLDKRADGQPVIKLSSDRAVSDPFIDMLLEFNWSSGRLVREFTFLLDPLEMLSRATAPVTPVVAAPVQAAGAAVPPRSVDAIDGETRSRAIRAVKGGGISAAPASEPVQPAAKPEAHQVKPGETLHRIAIGAKPEGVTLEQMLVGLLRANPDAFDGGNMNRLRAGKILTVPEKSTIDNVTAGEARKIVVKQTSEWNAYRSRLAAVAAKSAEKGEAARQETSGKITARVEEKAASESGAKDRLKVSSTTVVAAPAVDGAGKLGEEDSIAREQALKDANERLAALEKNVAELQKQAASKGESAEAKAPAVEPQAAAPVAAATPAAQKEPAPAPTVPASPPAVEKAPPKPAAEMPKPKPRPAPPPPPLEEPGFFASLFDSPLALAGGGGILALLAGLFYMRRRESRKEAPIDLSSTLTPQSSSLSANSVFRNTGGQSVDTSQMPVHTDFSQAGPGSIDTDEVDPVAEADVYMVAYGRDAQAEEILLEEDPQRLAVSLKLLEIYANRADTAKFEGLATELYGETSGVGADWEKVAVMGRKLDPDNPLFKGMVSTEAFDPDATLIVSPESIRDAVSLHEASAPVTVAAGEAETQETVAKAASPDFNHLDFDLGEDESAVPKKEAPISGKSESEEVSNVLDFDLGAGEEEKPSFSKSEAVSPLAAESVEAETEENVLDFDLGTSAPEVSPPPAALADEAVVPSRTEEPRVEFSDLDFDMTGAPSEAEKQLAESLEKEKGNPVAGFDFDLAESASLGRPESATPSFDMTSIDLDLAAPETESSQVGAVSDQAGSAEKTTEDSALENTVVEEGDRQAETCVAPAFEATETETQILPPAAVGEESIPPLAASEEELAATNVNPDFEALQMEAPPPVSPATAEPVETPSEANEIVVSPPAAAGDEMLSEFEFSANEEVATKLDLAKAYEEMGDLEGARELLNEVLNEGDATQQEKAQAILARIGE